MSHPNLPLLEKPKSMSEAAHELVLFDSYPVFPCHPSTKAPLTPKGFKDATDDTVQIERWWATNPHAMIGVPTGSRSGFFVIDLDIKPANGIDGPAELAKLEAKHGALPLTATQITPSGGRHLLFKMPSGRRINSSAGRVAAGIDVRGDGGYIVIAPSTNATGKTYEWVRPLSGTSELAEAPSWLLDLIESRPSATANARKLIGDPSLMANDLVMFGRAVDLLPNDDPVYDNWVKKLAAMKAGCGGDQDFFAEHVLPWCQKYPENTPDIAEQKWESIRDAEIGADYIYAKARILGFREVDDFHDDLPPELETSVTTAKGFHAPKPRLLPFDFDHRRPPLRQWVLGRRFMAGAITQGIGAPGAGKTTFAILTALAIVTGRELTGEPIYHQGAVWVHSNEEPIDELYRKVFALMLHYGISFSDIRQKLFVTSGLDHSLVVTARIDDQVCTTIAVEEMVSLIREHEVIHLVVDPLVSTHRGVSENNNEEMEKVADAFRTIAHQTQCSIDLLHHSMKTQSRKASSLAGDQYLGRGASAMIGAVRFAYTVTLVPEKDAEKLGIPTEFKKRGMRIDQAKANYAPHDDGATVFLMRSVKLMNGDEINMDGDSVGVPDLLKHAGPATTRLSQAKKVLDAIAGVFKRDTVTLKEILPAVKAAINCEDRTARKLIAEALPIEKSVFVSCGGIPYKFQRLRHKGKFVVNRTRVETSDASGIDA